ncbi:FixH family protein [Desulfallas thermosapovorans]|uniref:Nickel transport protein n=1 Tax=Desulfallas thermosapovorans DSM 6562 TaxID=1121431 RepID=A0A5S4ZXK5_9FIRM|nr:FixH family protein [Desulfallas thermosapovorans]TYO97423.1 nickel transport protein [Desulfallas thermosapovorans DSM 6562]
MKKIFIIFITVLLMLWPVAAFAHGVDINYQTKTAVEIVAKFDTGQPVSGAQVIVYAPDNPTEPWVTGKADENGRYIFTPDPSKPGTWDVQVRLAGHGGVVHVPVGGDNTAASGSTGYGTIQIVVMSACVIWGFIGTALYFGRRKS